MASGSQDEERKKLRQEYRALETNIAEHQDELLDLATGKFENCLSKVSDLQDQVHHPNDLAKGAQLLCKLSISLDKVLDNELQGQGLTPQAIITALKARFPSGQAPNHVDWTRLGQAVAPILPFAHGVSTLLVPEPEAPVARRQAQRRPRSQLAAVVTAEPLNGVQEDADKQETDKNMEDMWTILKRVRSTAALELVLNHESFSQTVENTFSLQFLVKEGRVSMTHDEEKGDMVHVVQKEAGDKSKHKEGEASQMVWHWTVPLWEAAKKVVTAQDCLMAHRIYKY